MPITTDKPTPDAPTVQAPALAPAPVQAVLENPSAGGNYLRDPLTGALTPNPAFQPAQASQEPQE